MNVEQARQILASHFFTGWATAQPSIPALAEGVETPDLTSLKTAFVVFVVDLPRADRGDLAGDNSLKRYRGVMRIELFVPEGKGTKPFAEMTDTLNSLLGSQTISGVRTYSVSPIRRTPAIGWQGRSIVVGYSFDSID